MVHFFKTGSDNTTLLAGVSKAGERFVVGPATGMEMTDRGLYIVFSKGTSGGSVVVETAHEAGYTGKWAPVGKPINWEASDRCHYVGIPGTYLALSVRVKDQIQGGTVSVYGVGTR